MNDNLVWQKLGFWTSAFITHNQAKLTKQTNQCKLQTSAFYFPTFEKADCTMFALLAGRSMSPLTFLLLYNRLEQKKTKIRIQNKRFALFTWSSFKPFFTCCLFMSAASFSSKLFVAKSAFLPMIFKYLCLKVCSSSNYFINDQ